MGLLGGPVHGQELELMILIDPFQLRIFCNSHDLLIMCLILCLGWGVTGCACVTHGHTGASRMELKHPSREAGMAVLPSLMPSWSL